MSISKEARRTMSHVLGAMRPEPPEDLTEEQGQIWREITADLPSARVSGLDVLLLTEYCRHISYARTIDEHLARLRETPLSGAEDAETARLICLQFAHEAREESRVIADLAAALGFCGTARVH